MFYYCFSLLLRIVYPLSLLAAAWPSDVHNPVCMFTTTPCPEQDSTGLNRLSTGLIWHPMGLNWLPMGPSWPQLARNRAGLAAQAFDRLGTASEGVRHSVFSGGHAVGRRPQRQSGRAACR